MHATPLILNSAWHVLSSLCQVITPNISPLGGEENEKEAVDGYPSQRQL
jgi:hypothetical protein